MCSPHTQQGATRQWHAGLQPPHTAWRQILLLSCLQASSRLRAVGKPPYPAPHASHSRAVARGPTGRAAAVGGWSRRIRRAVRVWHGSSWSRAQAWVGKIRGGGGSLPAAPAAGRRRGRAPAPTHAMIACICMHEAPRLALMLFRLVFALTPKPSLAGTRAWCLCAGAGASWCMPPSCCGRS